jgi:hypothetical protein
LARALLPERVVAAGAVLPRAEAPQRSVTASRMPLGRGSHDGRTSRQHPARPAL